MYATTNSQHSFQLQSDGFVAGTIVGKFPDRYSLEGGVVATGQTTPIYGGIPLANTVTAPSSSGGSSGLGESLTAAATTGANINSWCVFDQASAGVISATSPAPLYYAGMSANYVRVGSGVWIALPINPTAVNTLAAASATTAIYWDFTNNRVDVSGTGALGYQIIALNQNSKTVTYAAGPPITAKWNNSGSVIVVRV